MYRYVNGLPPVTSTEDTRATPTPEFYSPSPGIRIRALQLGDSASTKGTVVFLHGVGARADRWVTSMRACVDAGWRCIAIDFPGHGYSTKGALTELTVPALARTVREVCRLAAVVDAVLVGTSLGGHVAAALTVEDPSFTVGLVLVGPIGIAAETDAVRSGLARAIADTTRSGIERKLHLLLHDRTLVTDAWIDEEFAINNSEGAAESFAAFAHYFETVYNDHTVGTLLRSVAPEHQCLLLWGADDVLVPASQAAGIRPLLPRAARHVVIDRAGHAPYLDRPDHFNRLLLEFLDSCMQTAVEHQI